jgi:membrane-bound lytic murein transglycosylase D
MGLRVQWYLCCMAIGLAAAHPAIAQMISTKHRLNAQAQLLLHMDGLEGSWEVMNARANEPGKAETTQEAVLPDDDQLERELASTLGEVKMELSPRVKDFIALFARQRRRTTEAILGVASIYGPVVARRLAELGMPPVLSLLPAALSAYHLRAVSERGDVGLWQLNHYVALKEGLTCNSAVDERRDLYKSTKAALAYLAELHAQYHDWTLALAAYTCGPAGVTRARQRAGAEAGFEQLYSFLPEEGRDYLPAFGAAAYVITHSGQLGLLPLQMESMPLPDQIPLQEPLRFALVAKALRIPEDQLRNMNPVCRSETVPGLGMTVPLCLPQGYGQRFSLLKDSLYKAQLRQEAETRQVEPARSAETSGPAVPMPPNQALPKPYAPPAGTVPLTYTIRSGDNAGLIAQWYGLPLKGLMEMNGLKSDGIRAGNRLTLFVPKADALRLSKVETMTFAQKQEMVRTGAMPPTKQAPQTPSSHYTLYTVKNGDNLWLIAKKYPGVTPEAIMKVNRVDARLQPGILLKIPKHPK